MKRIGIVIAALLCIALLCGGFYYAKNRASSSDDVELTKVQKIIARNLESNYPATPREVVKLYNRIITSYYDETYTDEEFEALAEQARGLFDADLLANNPVDQYEADVKAEVVDYEQRSRQIRQTSVCDSDDVLYLTDDSNGDQLAYVSATYFIKEGNSFERTYQMYVLRKDENEEWKILTYYKIDKTASEDESDDE
jgi:hypothetical protein